MRGKRAFILSKFKLKNFLFYIFLLKVYFTIHKVNIKKHGSKTDLFTKKDLSQNYR